MADAPALTPDEVAALWSTWFGAELPEACRAGVARNLALLAEHRQLVATALESTGLDG